VIRCKVCGLRYDSAEFRDYPLGGYCCRNCLDLYESERLPVVYEGFDFILLANGCDVGKLSIKYDGTVNIKAPGSIRDWFWLLDKVFHYLKTRNTRHFIGFDSLTNGKYGADILFTFDEDYDGPFFINHYLADQIYGGPEQGGWYYGFYLFVTQVFTGTHDEVLAEWDLLNNERKTWDHTKPNHNLYIIERHSGYNRSVFKPI